MLLCIARYTDIVTKSKIEQLAEVPQSQVDWIFNLWRIGCQKNTNTKLDDKREVLIRRAIRDFGVTDTARAVIGWKYSAFHCGDNPEGRVYNNLELLLRDAAHIEQFRDLAINKPKHAVNFKQHVKHAKRSGSLSARGF